MRLKGECVLEKPCTYGVVFEEGHGEDAGTGDPEIDKQDDQLVFND
jgi:hypothetical protein